jgi:hypothetical protein
MKAKLVFDLSCAEDKAHYELISNAENIKACLDDIIDAVQEIESPYDEGYYVKEEILNKIRDLLQKYNLKP